MERLLNRLQPTRRPVTRDAPLAVTYLALVIIAAILNGVQRGQQA